MTPPFGDVLSWGMALDSLPNMATQVLGWITAAGLSVGLVVSITWAAFRLFAKSWLQTQFDRQLAVHQRRQDELLEQAKSRFAAHLDRATRLHSAEFEVLPEAWKKLREASVRVRRLMHPLQSYLPVRFVSTEQLEAALAAYPLREGEKESLRDEDDGHERQRQYNAMVDRCRHSEAYDVYLEFHNFLAVRGIYIDPELRRSFYKASDVLQRALKDYGHIAFSDVIPQPWEEARKRFADGLAIESAMEDEIDARLWRGHLTE